MLTRDIKFEVLFPSPFRQLAEFPVQYQPRQAPRTCSDANTERKSKGPGVDAKIIRCDIGVDT